METVRVHPDKLFTKSEYAKVYQISRPTIDKYIKEGTLKTMTVKGAVLIKVE